MLPIVFSVDCDNADQENGASVLRAEPLHGTNKAVVLSKAARLGAKRQPIRQTATDPPPRQSWEQLAAHLQGMRSKPTTDQSGRVTACNDKQPGLCSVANGGQFP